MERDFGIRMERFEVVGFYPYTSRVSCRVIGTGDDDMTDLWLKNIIGPKVREMVEQKGCSWDNKVVVEFKLKPEIFSGVIIQSNIFIGCYDGDWHIGFAVIQPDSYMKQYNKQF